MLISMAWFRRRPPYEPLITVEVSREHILHNLKQFQKIHPTHAIAPVLKSNAYGHGLVEVAHILENLSSASIPFFAVDSYFEALALRSNGIAKPLLIIGYNRPETILENRLRNIVFTITSVESLRHLVHSTRTVRIHLKIDTGMHRQGILPEELDEAMDILVANPQIELEGILSHLCDADNRESWVTEVQIRTWDAVVKRFRLAFPMMHYTHLNATDGYRLKNESSANLSRLGIGLYGLADGASFNPPLHLIPALEMKTLITGVKKLKRDETVGYSATFKAERDMTIATIAVGYYEGIDRRLSNNGFVLVGPQRIPCPLIGRISMNISTIDVSHLTDAKEGMEVVVISSKLTDPNSIAEITKRSNTIAYEVVVKIPAQLKRRVV